MCLQGILYVLHNNIAWQLLLLKLRFGRTGFRRLERLPPRLCEPSLGPGHTKLVTGASGSATAVGADRR